MAYQTYFNNPSPFMQQQFSPMQQLPQPVQQGAMGIPAQAASNPQAGFRCLPVTSFAQVEAFQIPFDGSTTYFVDTSNGKLYSKTFDFNTGTAFPVTYVREQALPAVQYATIDDLNALREEIERLKKPSRKAAKNDDAEE